MNGFYSTRLRTYARFGIGHPSPITTLIQNALTSMIFHAHLHDITWSLRNKTRTAGSYGSQLELGMVVLSVN